MIFNQNTHIFAHFLGHAYVPDGTYGARLRESIGLRPIRLALFIMICWLA